jgi:pyruvate-formate lyase
MFNSFYKNRRYLDDEYENANWNEKSGQDADTLSANLKKFVDDHLDMPMILLRAKAFEYFLENVQIEINPHNIFADKINTGVRYVQHAEKERFFETDKEIKHEKFASQDIFTLNFYTRFNKEVQEREIPYEYRRNQQAERTGIGTAWADYWHTLPDWSEVLRLGFPGLLRRAEDMKARKKAGGELTKEQEEFYDSVIISYRAILGLMRRLREESLKYDIPWYTECLEHLMHHPPETMYQVLEAVYLFLTLVEIGVENARSLGIIDLLYYPYYKADIESGRYSEEEIREMFRYFFNKLNAARRFAAQPLTLCGINPEDKNAENGLTFLILDIYDELGNTNPKIQFRYRAAMSDELLDKVLSLIRKGHSAIVTINDEAVYRGYEKIGIPREESASYVPIGCYEPVIMGKEDPMICSAFINIVKAAEFAVTGGRDILTGEVFGIETPGRFDEFNDFLDAFYKHVDYIIEFFIDNIDKQTALSMKINPSPVLSSTIGLCMEKGKDYFSGGMKYNNTTIKCYGLATTVDSILAVKKLVFDEKLLTHEELQDALYNNWQGYEKIQMRIRNDRNKYGNNMEEPDKLMKEIMDHLAGLIVGRKNARGGVYRLGCDSIGICVIQGKRTGATPDGRNAREPVSKNLCAVSGMERNGVTALMQSVLKLDHDSLLGSEPLDILLHPSAVRGEAGLKAVNALFRTYFASGGIALQGNVVDAETLMAAQKEPYKYRNLQVRLCGWNAYFVDLSTVHQNEFIKQTRAM